MKNDVKKKIVIKVLLTMLVFVIIIVLCNLPNANSILTNNYDISNNIYLSKIKQKPYSEGTVANIKYYIYTFNSDENIRNYLVVFWNMSTTNYEISYHEYSTILKSNDTSSFTVSEKYSSGGYLNIKEFVISEYNDVYKEPSTFVIDENNKMCLNGNSNTNTFIFVDRNGNINNAIKTNEEYVCNNSDIYEYIVIKND